MKNKEFFNAIKLLRFVHEKVSVEISNKHSDYLNEVDIDLVSSFLLFVC